MKPNNWNNCESEEAIGRSPKILIDNGHGIETPGKRSPDGVLREYAWNRLIASRIVDRLLSLGLDAELLVPEERDISLPERCRRVNAWCRQLGKDNVILISIHANAAGRGDRWYDGTGWAWNTTYSVDEYGIGHQINLNRMTTSDDNNTWYGYKAVGTIEDILLNRKIINTFEPYNPPMGMFAEYGHPDGLREMVEGN